MTTEMIKEEGWNHCFCPYYYPSHIKEKADIIFMPYNYLLDVSLSSRYATMVRNSILIFDEAHNVPDASCEGRSFTITSKTFDNILQEVKKL